MGGEMISEAMERHTICFPHRGTQGVLQNGDTGFRAEIDRLYNAADSNVLESLMKLKTHLRTLSTEDFWSAVTEGLSNILGAEMTFVCKRVLSPDHDSLVEMPPYGEKGSCTMAVAFHYCNRDGSRSTIKNSTFNAYGCPCAYMRHDKVFLISEHLNDFITDNPNELPMPAEAYIAVPMFAEGKCFAHFGAMWAKEGAARRTLSWAFIEILLHSLEDMIQQRLIQGSDLVRPALSLEKPKVIPHEAVAVAQSLRPYAGSLSHELRTPMQGIVGMLDIMYATVQEADHAALAKADPKLHKIFEDLIENIHVVRDSSRRAVEAADNVVHAYDMDMSVLDGPSQLPFDDLDSASPFSMGPIERRPDILIPGSNLPLSRKRRRDDTFSRQSSNASNSKFQRVEGAMSAWSRAAQPSQELRDGLQQAEDVQSVAKPGATPADAPTEEDAELAANSLADAKRMILPGLRHTQMREVLQYVINEGLKMGGRPDYTMAQETECGEIIEVRSRRSDGRIGSKVIEWSVDPNMPHTLFTDEKDLSKLISCVFLNAIKFTDQNGGRVGVYARVSSRGRCITINVSDNGPGIPAAFFPKLFKPFSRENESITRQSEGLGLGLMVAKGIARKLGGDLRCIRAETEGSNHGSEFEIRVPVIAGDTITRPSSPHSSPMPRQAAPAPIRLPRTPTAIPALESPTSLSHALHEAVNAVPYSCGALPSTPISPKTLQPRALSKTSQPTLIVTSSPPTPPDETVSPPLPRPRVRKSVSSPAIDRDLATKYPLTFLVAEDNKINRKLLVSMLGKFGYKTIYEAHDGADAVRQMKIPRSRKDSIDVVLMDLWMPFMDGYEATERILAMEQYGDDSDSEEPDSTICLKPTVLAVTADVTDAALERAASVGMKGYMTKPYKIYDLQRLITEYCAQRAGVDDVERLPLVMET